AGTPPRRAIGRLAHPAPRWLAMWAPGREANFASAIKPVRRVRERLPGNVVDCASEIKHVRRMREPPTLARYRASVGGSRILRTCLISLAQSTTFPGSRSRTLRTGLIALAKLASRPGAHIANHLGAGWASRPIARRGGVP